MGFKGIVEKIKGMYKSIVNIYQISKLLKELERRKKIIKEYEKKQKNKEK